MTARFCTASRIRSRWKEPVRRKDWLWMRGAMCMAAKSGRGNWSNTPNDRPQQSQFDMGKKPIVGVAGCGSMGLPMAQALQQAGYEVGGLDVRPANEFGSFRSRMLEDPAEFASRPNVIISVVRD